VIGPQRHAPFERNGAARVAHADIRGALAQHGVVAAEPERDARRRSDEAALLGHELDGGHLPDLDVIEVGAAAHVGLRDVESLALGRTKTTLTLAGIGGEEEDRSRRFFTPDRSGSLVAIERRTRARGPYLTLQLSRQF
jgi:hypothetical protein